MTISEIRDQNWENYVDPRAKLLIDNKYYLEAFYIYEVTIEHSLQGAIKYQEALVKTILKKSKFNFTETEPEKLKEKTLGQLIALFARYCDDGLIISKLNEFNSFRKKVIHHLLDHDLNKLNNEAEGKLRLYYELVSNISRYNIEVLEKLIAMKQIK